MAERDTRKSQEDVLFDLMQLYYSTRDENGKISPEKIEMQLDVMINRAQNGMSNDEVDAVEKRVKSAFKVK